ncbi:MULTISPECIES: hypothetical protein [unclassified Clostridium]|uniref:hypothetical protein n=1 Tax=unclassified Clostridium TaxID=2614128 RepID=UPI0002980EF0|nr:MULTISPECIES: hypothetical protein [unclassified Clostridium]EKQ51578.1 MAG: hypothetical protein A370_04756 [Clostridium sp. Maddingley MBC34-26]
MKKFFVFVLLCLYLSFNTTIITSLAASQAVKEGFYSISNLNLSPDTKHFVQNNSFTDRAYVLIFDSKPNFLQAIRLRPQSKKFDLIPLKDGYTIVVVGSGAVNFS